MKSIFFSTIKVISEKPFKEVRMYKRFMFGINKIRNFKKSGDIIITVDNKKALDIGVNTNVNVKLSSLDLATDKIINGSTASLSPRQSLNNCVYTRQINRFFADYERTTKFY
jgi:cell division GTPase FtsZ